MNSGEISHSKYYSITSVSDGQKYLQLNVGSSSTDTVQANALKTTALAKSCRIKCWDGQQAQGGYHNFCSYWGYRKPVTIQSDSGSITVYVCAKDAQKLGVRLDDANLNQFHQTLSKTASYMQGIPTEFWTKNLSPKKTIVEQVGAIGEKIENLEEGQFMTITSGESTVKHSKGQVEASSRWKWNCFSTSSAQSAEQASEILVEKRGSEFTAQKVSGIIGVGAFAEVRGAGDYAIRVINPLKTRSQDAVAAAENAQYNLQKMHGHKGGCARGIEPVPRTISHFNASTGVVSATHLTVTPRALGDLYDIASNPGKKEIQLTTPQKQRCAQDITEGYLTMHECGIINIDIKSKNILLVGKRNLEGGIEEVEGAQCSDWDAAVDMDKYDSVSDSTAEHILSDDNEKWTQLNSARSLIDQASQFPDMRDFTFNWLKSKQLIAQDALFENYDVLIPGVQQEYKNHLNRISVFQIGLILYELYTGNSAAKSYHENGYIASLHPISSALEAQEGLSTEQKNLISRMLSNDLVQRPSFQEIAVAFKLPVL